MPISGIKESLPPLNMLQLFEASVLSRPNEIAMIDAGTETLTTFHELNKKSNILARYLMRKMNLTKEKKMRNPDGDLVIGVCIPPSTDLIIALFAILKLGGAYLPLDVDFPPARVEQILQDSKPELLLTYEQNRATSHVIHDSNQECQIICLDKVTEQINQESYKDVTDEEIFKISTSGDFLVAVLYTSGSTGIPKGVRLFQKAIMNRLVWQWRTFPYTTNEVCCFKTALTFVDSISEIFGPLLTSHTVVIVPKKMTTEVEDLIRVLENSKIERLVLVPSLLRSILIWCSRLKMPALQELRLWICSGEVFPTDLLHSFFTVFKNNQIICNFYGSTEVLGDVTYIQFNDALDVEEKLFDNKVPIGYPIMNSKIYLMDSSLEKEVVEGTLGEILVTGMNLCCGYVGNTQPEKFIPNLLCQDNEYDKLYRTGDFGYLSRGILHYGGRTDSQMKIRGHRIDLNEVQMALQKTQGIDKCYVTCHHPGELDQALLGYFTSAKESPESVKPKLSLLLPRYMIPQLIKLEELPLLVNGKVDRQQLLRMYEANKADCVKSIELDLSALIDEDKYSIGETLMRTIVRVIGPAIPSKISLEDNFFDLGGNSLNAILAITSLEDAGLSVDIGTFLKATNLHQVLNQIVADDDTSSTGEEDAKYRCVPLSQTHMEMVIDMVSNGFASKGDFETCAGVKYEHFEFTMKHMWETFLEQGLSFVVTDAITEEVLAVSLNDDLQDMPPLVFNSEMLKHIFDFLGECEDSCSSTLPQMKGDVFHSELMGTSFDISPAENLILLQVMERENFELAKLKGFKLIFTTNTSATTQHICEDILGYKPVLTRQLSSYVSEDGKKPFENAGDELFATCSIYWLKD